MTANKCFGCGEELLHDALRELERAPAVMSGGAVCVTISEHSRAVLVARLRRTCACRARVPEDVNR